MSLASAINIADLKRRAKRRLPWIIFDFVEGGLEDELGMARNKAAFAAHGLVPRYLVDVSRLDQSRTVFGRRYASPFGLAPTGGMGMIRPLGDHILGAAAATADIPFVLSGASSAAIEAIAKVAPKHFWSQLYGAHDAAVNDDLVRRAKDAGAGALVLTVDVPQRPKRERNIRNGFSHNFKMRPKLVLDGLMHPAWTLDYLRYGVPGVESWIPYAPKGAGPRAITDYFDSQTPAAAQIWRDAERYRKIFPGPFILKGIMHPADAVRAAEVGADGVIVSNHGGRQLDRSPASLEALPAIKAAVGDRMTVMLDSGIRRGADIATALCLGADFVFIGRASVYGLAAGGRAGIDRAIEILRSELSIIQGQMGCPTLADFTPDRVVPPR
jgi:L-lactate dehydrogenase (cytochrome)/(S)-mandelate dehydrogenase